jgi:hypothetical protein
MSIFIIVEGDSDKIILESQLAWFDSLGLKMHFVPVGGKQSMIKKAKAHYHTATSCGAEKVIFLPYKHNDPCALITREKIGMDSLDKATTIVVKCEIEAWVLADGECVRQCACVPYHPAGQTDTEIDPKQKLQSQLKHKFGSIPLTSIEAAKKVAPHFSIHRAARNNTSAKRFKEFIVSISSSCH